MDRYHETEADYHTPSRSRTSRNEELYQDLGKTMKYTSFTTEIPAVELQAVQKNYKTREGYQQMKEYEDFFEEENLPAAKKELKELNALYENDEAKVYDINSVLEQAKKERTLIDEREKKRKLKNENNIAATMDEKEVNAIKNRKKIFEESEQEELQELIDTITSHELRKDIDAAQEGGLLADLMATSLQDKIEAPVPQNTPREEKKKDPFTTIADKKLADQGLDNSFYTRSMDLSEKDFDIDNEIDEEMKESRGMLILKLFFLIILLIVVVVGSYFIIQSF